MPQLKVQPKWSFAFLRTNRKACVDRTFSNRACDDRYVCGTNRFRTPDLVCSTTRQKGFGHHPNFTCQLQFQQSDVVCRFCTDVFCMFDVGVLSFLSLGFA